MSSIMSWQLRSLLAACLLLGCTPSEFDYGGGEQASPACHQDPCPAGCPAGFSAGPNGDCVPDCQEWGASINVQELGGLVADESGVYALGSSSPDLGRPARAHFQRADACTGKLQPAVLSLSEEGSSIAAAAAGEAGSLVVGGTNEGMPLLAELDPVTGSAKLVELLPSLPAEPVMKDLDAGPSGVWMVGGSKAGTAWYAHRDAGTPCSVAVPAFERLSAVVTTAAAAYAVGEGGGRSHLIALAPGCAPPGSTAEILLPGLDSISARDLFLVDATAYVVGHARVAAGEPFGFVAELGLPSATLVALTKWDAAPGADVLEAVTVVGSNLFAGGVAGAQTADDTQQGQARVAAWSLPLANDAAPTWWNYYPAQRVQVLARNGASVFALAPTGIGEIAHLQRIRADIAAP
jgi:hypothetical protein